MYTYKTHLVDMSLLPYKTYCGRHFNTLFSTARLPDGRQVCHLFTTFRAMLTTEFCKNCNYLHKKELLTNVNI